VSPTFPAWDALLEVAVREQAAELGRLRDEVDRADVCKAAP
jgi:hypothetical protein